MSKFKEIKKFFLQQIKKTYAEAIILFALLYQVLAVWETLKKEKDFLVLPPFKTVFISFILFLILWFLFCYMRVRFFSRNGEDKG